MKRISKVFVVVILMMTVAYTATAQKAQKIGHIDFPGLIQMMPGQDSINKAYETYAKGLENQITTMQAELENKQLDYEANQATLSSIIRQTKEKELQDLYNRLVDFNQKAQQDLQNYENELLNPLIEKARNAVNAVAKEKGYTYILNTAQGMVLYFESGDDIMPFVKTKIGIQ
ncbi:MAG: OmpH family outer membrane protein [Bacteroidales bacterium]|nr:OmpH family outer membrane protein [Bacteroidales bacterium]